MNIKNMKNLIAPKFITFSVIALSLLAIPATQIKANYQVGWQGDTYVGYQAYTPPVNNINNYVVNPVPVVTYVSPNSVPRNSYQTITVSGYNFIQGSVIRINGTDLMTTYLNSGTLTTELNPTALQYSSHYSVAVFNPSPAGGISNQVTFTIKDNYNTGYANNTQTTNNGTNNTQASNQNNSSNSTNTQDATTATTKDLAASAIFGSNAFMPSSLLQWIFFFILILLGVILWRRLYVSEEEKRMPLKHA